MKIVECVPNFSEGRRPEIVDRIVAAGSDVAGVTLLGKEADRDHNRAVVTFIGPPEACAEAAFRMTAEAIKHIDLTKHQGAHPRMGATDVIPFIPVQDVTMEECVALARKLGERIGAELGVPVFFYADAASRPERTRLPDIRAGEFEGLKERIGTDPTRAPDAGPQKIHPTAGCTAVGARFFLIAYNVNLATPDVGLAKDIAKNLRESGYKVVKTLADGTKSEEKVKGLFTKLQANGFELAERGLSQISMNLMDYRATSIETVYAEIERRAKVAGVAIAESEIVGLVPRDALLRSMAERIKLAGFKSEQVIEWHLDRAREDVFAAPDAFLEALQSGAPTPGGGSAAALAGALGAALGAMVSNLTIGKKKFAEVEGSMKAARARLLAGLDAMRRAVREDAVQYDRVMGAYKLPKATPEEAAKREAVLNAALVDAAKAPLDVMRTATALLPDLLFVAEHGNPNAASDAAVGALMVKTCVHGSAYNTLINAKSLGAHPEAAPLKSACETIRAACDAEAAKVLATVDAKL
jgi:glutamate formiminotransferase / formiminotetrahydrofolate cyclodeaminase